MEEMRPRDGRNEVPGGRNEPASTAGPNVIHSERAIASFLPSDGDRGSSRRPVNAKNCAGAHIQAGWGRLTPPIDGRNEAQIMMANGPSVIRGARAGGSRFG
mgnify:CR=1 FL=1